MLFKVKKFFVYNMLKLFGFFLILFVNNITYSDVIEFKGNGGISFVKTSNGEIKDDDYMPSEFASYTVKSGKNITLKDSENNRVDMFTDKEKPWILKENNKTSVKKHIKGYDAEFEGEMVSQEKPKPYIMSKNASWQAFDPETNKGSIITGLEIKIKNKAGDTLFEGPIGRLFLDKDNENYNKVKKYFGIKITTNDYGDNFLFRHYKRGGFESVEKSFLESLKSNEKLEFSIIQDGEEVSSKTDIKIKEDENNASDISDRLAYNYDEDEVVYTISADDVEVSSTTLNVEKEDYDKRENGGNRGKIYKVNLKENSIAEKYLDKKLKDKIDNKADIEELEKYLRKDGSNITSENKGILKEKLDIGNGEVKLGDGKTVTGDTVYKALNQIDDSYKSATASAMAMSAIPQVAADKLFSFGASIANYDRKNAVALGISGQNKNRNFVYKLSASISEDKKVGISAGINYSFGKIEESSKDYDKEIRELKEIIKELQERKPEIILQDKKEMFFYIDNFNFDDDKITKENEEKIRNIVNILNDNYANSKVKVIGYTDLKGSDKYNLNLGLKRANEVVKKLKEFGLNENIKIEQVLSRGYNQIKNGTYAELRRVDIIVK